MSDKPMGKRVVVKRVKRDHDMRYGITDVVATWKVGMCVVSLPDGDIKPGDFVRFQYVTQS
jgi:hypothetical protein